MNDLRSHGRPWTRAERVNARSVAERDNTLRAARILFVADLDPSRKFGSLEEFVLTLAREQARRGGIVVPVFNSPPGSALAARFAAVGSPVPACLNLRNLSWDTTTKLLRLIDTHQIDVVDISFYSPLNPFVLLAQLLRRRVRFVFTDHSSRNQQRRATSPVKRLVRRLFVGRYAATLAISDYVRGDLERRGATNLSRCTLFINADRFRREPLLRQRLRAEAGSEGAFVALAVAQLIPAKGIDVALRAIARLPASVHLWVAGRGPEETRLRTLAESLGMAGRVRFWGEQADVAPLLSAADCLVCPSLWHEAMGFVNLEAAAAGLPVVASRIGGIPEFVLDGETGVLFPPDDAQACADALARLANDTESRERMGQNALRRSADFSWQRRCPEHLRIYDRIAGLATD